MSCESIDSQDTPLTDYGSAAHVYVSYKYSSPAFAVCNKRHCYQNVANIESFYNAIHLLYEQGGKLLVP